MLTWTKSQLSSQDLRLDRTSLEEHATGTQKDGATSYQWAFKICSASARDFVLHNHKPAVQCHSSSELRCCYGPPNLPGYWRIFAAAIYILTVMLERTVLRNFVPAAFPSSSSASEPSCACTEYKCLCVVSYITNGTGRMEGDQTRDVENQDHL